MVEARGVKYEEDLIAGDVFGEVAFEGVHTRHSTALSITTCDLIVVDADDFIAIQEGGSKKASVEERFKYLSNLSLFRAWEPYRLIRVAQVLQQEELTKGSVIQRKGEVSKRIMFIRTGRVDLLHNLEKPREIVTYIESNEYLGESGFLNACFQSNRNSNETSAGAKSYAECCFAVAYGRLELFTLAEEHFSVFDAKTAKHLLTAFLEKTSWRISRSVFLREETRKQKSEKLRLIREQKKAEQEESLLTAQQLVKIRQHKEQEEKEGRRLDLLRRAHGSGSTSNVLVDLEEIPFLVDTGSDPLLIINTCKNEAELRATTAMIREIYRPKSARSRRGSGCSVYDLQEPGFTNTYGSVDSLLANNSIALSIPNTSRSTLSQPNTMRSRSGSLGSDLGDGYTRPKLTLPLLPGAYLASFYDRAGSEAPPHTPKGRLMGSARIPAVKSYYEMLTAGEAMVELPKLTEPNAVPPPGRMSRRDSIGDLSNSMKSLLSSRQRGSSPI